jgi:hypothetical protein
VCPYGCGADHCLGQAPRPEKTCTTAADCALPASVCVGDHEQMVFTDPTCDDGACRWKQLVNVCGPVGYGIRCKSGQCYDPGMQTRTGMMPVISVDPVQPPDPPAHACTKAADCPAPPPSCFNNWTVEYAAPACHDGACAWPVSLAECRFACSEGVCGGS